MISSRHSSWTLHLSVKSAKVTFDTPSEDAFSKLFFPSPTLSGNVSVVRIIRYVRWMALGSLSERLSCIVLSTLFSNRIPKSERRSRCRYRARKEKGWRIERGTIYTPTGVIRERVGVRRGLRGLLSQCWCRYHLDVVVPGVRYERMLRMNATEKIKRIQEEREWEIDR